MRLQEASLAALNSDDPYETDNTASVKQPVAAVADDRGGGGGSGGKDPPRSDGGQGTSAGPSNTTSRSTEPDVEQ